MFGNVNPDPAGAGVQPNYNNSRLPQHPPAARLGAQEPIPLRNNSNSNSNNRITATTGVAAGLRGQSFRWMHMFFALTGFVLFLVSVAYVGLVPYGQHGIGIALGLLSMLTDFSAIRLFRTGAPTLVFSVISDLLGVAVAGAYLGVNRYEYQLFDGRIDEYVYDSMERNFVNLGRAAFILTILVGFFRVVSAVTSVILMCTSKGRQLY